MGNALRINEKLRAGFQFTMESEIKDLKSEVCALTNKNLDLERLLSEKNEENLILQEKVNLLTQMNIVKMINK
jgi:hypothetical protein